MKIEPIELPDGLFDSEFYICTIQLTTPFWNEVNENQRGSNHFFAWKDGVIEKRNAKCKKILDGLEQDYILSGIPLKLIVFPEYSIDETSIDFLQEYSLKHNLMIIGGLYDIDERQSLAVIIYPRLGKTEVVKQYKIGKSHLDEKYLADIEESNNEFIKLQWRPFTETSVNNFIHIFLCYDFLDRACKIDHTDEAGLFVVPMCSPKINEFFGLSYHIARSSQGNRSNVVILCNSSGTQGSTEKEKTACGESHIIGPYGGSLPKLDSSNEGGIIAKINLNTVESRMTRYKRSDVISHVVNFGITTDGILTEGKTLKTYPIKVLNPNSVLQPLGLHKIYAFYAIKNYYKIIEHIKKIPLQSNGIFGIYDILIHGYEEDWDSFERRLGSYLGEKFNDLKDPDLPSPKYFVVSHVLKYRGTPLMDVTTPRFLSRHNFNITGADYLEKNMKSMQAIALGKPVDKDKIKELVSNGIVIEVGSDSDVFPEERENGHKCEEHLVFVDIFPSGDRAIISTMKEFQNSILPLLMAENKVRTVEFCGKHFEADYSEGTYILHIVGNLNDVREIILPSIHSISCDKDLRCRTFVVPTAEGISKERFLSLGETILRNPQLRRTVYEIVYYLKFVNPFDPYIIKQLPIESILKIERFYSTFRNSVKKDKKEKRGEVLSKLNQYIYGICFGLREEKHIDSEVFDTLKGYCIVTFTHLSGKVEKFLDGKRNKMFDFLKSHPEYKPFFKKKMIGKKDVYSVIEDMSQTVLGDLQQVAFKWRETIDEAGKKVGEISDAINIIDISLELRLESLKPVIKYRNYLSHGFRKKLSDIRSAEFSNELLDATITAFDFVDDYCNEEISENK